MPLTERICSDFALTLTAVDSTFKDSVQHLANTKVIVHDVFNVVVVVTDEKLNQL